jgi:hypothetical protein
MCIMSVLLGRFSTAGKEAIDRRIRTLSDVRVRKVINFGRLGSTARRPSGQNV